MRLQEKVWEGHMRRAGAWDPLLRGLHLDKHLLQQPNARNLQGTKNYCMHMQLGHIMNAKIQKDQKSNCHFWGFGSKNRVLCVIPDTAPLRGSTDRLSHPSTSTITPFKGPARPPSGSKRGKLLLAFFPWFGSVSLNKALPECLILISFLSISVI